MSKNVRRKLVDNQYSSTIGTLLHYNITPYFGSREICVKITFIRVCIIHTFLRHQFIICYIFQTKINTYFVCLFAFLMGRRHMHMQISSTSTICGSISVNARKSSYIKLVIISMEIRLILSIILVNFLKHNQQYRVDKTRGKED